MKPQPVVILVTCLAAITLVVVVASMRKPDSDIESFSLVDGGGAPLVVDGEESLDSFWKNMDSQSVKDDVTAYKDQVATAAGSSASGKEMNASEFLPQEVNVNWFDKDFNTISQVDTNMLIDVSQYANGVDTVGQSLKNPSYDIRGNIPNPKSVISPFLNSSIEPDTNIKSWC